MIEPGLTTDPASLPSSRGRPGLNALSLHQHPLFTLQILDRLISSQLKPTNLYLTKMPSILFSLHASFP